MKIRAPIFKKFFIFFKKFLLSHKIISFILLSLIALVYIGVIFYVYTWQIKAPQDLPIKKIAVNSDLYQKMVDDFAKREANFMQEENKTYLDPFYR